MYISRTYCLHWGSCSTDGVRSSCKTYELLNKCTFKSMFILHAKLKIFYYWQIRKQNTKNKTRVKFSRHLGTTTEWWMHNLGGTCERFLHDRSLFNAKPVLPDNKRRGSDELITPATKFPLPSDHRDLC